MWPHLEDETKRAKHAIYKVENPYSVHVQDCSTYSSNLRIADFVFEVQADFIKQLEDVKLHKKVKYIEPVQNRHDTPTSSSRSSRSSSSLQPFSKPTKQFTPRIPRKVEPPKTTNYGSIHRRENQTSKRPDPVDVNYNPLSKVYQSKSAHQNDWKSASSTFKSPMSSLNFNRNSSKYSSSSQAAFKSRSSLPIDRSQYFQRPSYKPSSDNTNLSRNTSNLINLGENRSRSDVERSMNARDPRDRSNVAAFRPTDVRLTNPLVPPNFQTKISTYSSSSNIISTNPIIINSNTNFLGASPNDPRLAASIRPNDPRNAANRSTNKPNDPRTVPPPRSILKNSTTGTVSSPIVESINVGRRQTSIESASYGKGTGVLKNSNSQAVAAAIDRAGLLPTQSLVGPKVMSIKDYEMIENSLKNATHKTDESSKFFDKSTKHPSVPSVILIDDEDEDAECDKLPPAKRTQFATPQVPKVLKVQQRAFASSETGGEDIFKSVNEISLDIEKQIEKDMNNRNVTNNYQKITDDSDPNYEEAKGHFAQMACATLKRPLDWDHRLNNSPANTRSPPSSSSHRPNKRRCLFLDQPHVSPPKQPSPFSDVYPKYTPEEIALSIKAEMKKLKNRKQLNFSSVNRNPASTSSQLDVNTSNEFSSSTSSSNYNGTNEVGLLSPSRRDQPLFTFRQVGLICEKLIKERELLIREEYERVLTSKLAEQYDTFVKFTYDQIQKSFDISGTPSCK